MKNKLFLLCILVLPSCLLFGCASENIYASNDTSGLSNDEYVIVDETLYEEDTIADDTADYYESAVSSESPELLSKQSENVTEVMTKKTDTVVQPATDTEEPEEQLNSVDVSANYVAIQNVNIRKGPDTATEKLGELEQGDMIFAISLVEEKWYRFLYNNEDAYVSSEYLIEEEEYKELLKQQQEEENKKVKNANIVPTKAEDFPLGAEVVNLINANRTDANLGIVTEDARLDALAQIRAQEIVSYFEHERLDGRQWYTVLDDNGFFYLSAGENIAAGQVSADEVMTDWMNSPGHRENIMTADFKKVGIGYVSGGEYGSYWVQLFTD